MNPRTAATAIIGLARLATISPREEAGRPTGRRSRGRRRREPPPGRAGRGQARQGHAQVTALPRRARAPVPASTSTT